MSRIKEAFKDGKALIGFLTAGVPSAEDTLRYMGDLETAGADLIEIGVPFSDPVADGAVIMEGVNYGRQISYEAVCVDLCRMHRMVGAVDFF